MLERVSTAAAPFDLLVATTTDPEDDGVEAMVTDAGYDCFRGHPTDLLDRHYRAAARAHADVVVKIPSDCPLIDPAVIDLVLGAFFDDPERYDFASNLHPPTYPDGNDVEAMRFDALEAAFYEATRPHEREHTTPFIWDQPARFRIANVAWPGGRDFSMSHRFTIDYPEDYDFIRAVFERLYTPLRPVFSLDDILALLEREPDLGTINARYLGVNWYRHHLDELRTVSRDETRFPEEKR